MWGSKRHRCIEESFGPWEKARVGWSERIALKQVYYQWWNRPPAQGGCRRQVLRAGALGRPRGLGRGGRWEGGSWWGTHVNPWVIHVNVWQNPLQYCKVISLQLIKINEKKKKKKRKEKRDHSHTAARKLTLLRTEPEREPQASDEITIPASTLILACKTLSKVFS